MDLHCLHLFLQAMNRCDAAADVQDVISARSESESERLTSEVNEGQEHWHSSSSDDLRDECHPLQQTKSWASRGEERFPDAVREDVSGGKRQQVTLRPSLNEGEEHSDGT